jgi:hypothetical protein
MLRESALNFLKTKDARANQTVQLGWFIFRTINSEDGLDLETLDFKEMASFTKDFQIPDQIHWAQQETLRRLNLEQIDCTLVQPALVSRSYIPNSPHAFIERFVPSSNADSGWYVGMTDEQLDLEDINSFSHKSLYELTIYDERFARFWLLPFGYRIYFDEPEPRVIKVEQGAAANP